MFTGVILHIGILKDKDSSSFTFETDENFWSKLKKYPHISINGVRLNITDVKTAHKFTVQITSKIAKQTMLGKLGINDKVNLELPLTVQTPLSGHILRGTVEATGRIAAIKIDDDLKVLTITLPDQLSNYVVEKGPIAVNGISLTIDDAMPAYFTVEISPLVWKQTMFHTISVGDLVNIETDIFARYTESIIHKKRKEG
jgi:riboflavin synthase